MRAGRERGGDAVTAGRERGEEAVTVGRERRGNAVTSGRAVVLVFCAAVVAGLCAPLCASGANVLSVGSAAGNAGDVVTVAFGCANDDTVKGIQTDIQFDPAVVAFAGMARTARLGAMHDTSAVVGGNRVRLLLYHDGSESLLPGTGPLLDLHFRLVGGGGMGTVLRPTESVLSDPRNGPLPVTTTEGAITIEGGGTGENLLSFGRISGLQGGRVRVPIVLTNPADSVQALQIEVAYAEDVVRFLGTAGSARCPGMIDTALAVPNAPDRVRLVLYSPGRAFIPTGTGTIAELHFAVIGPIGTESPLLPENAIFASPRGMRLQTSVLAGSITSGVPLTLTLHLAAFKNPGRPRAVQVLVTADQPLVRPPEVTAGGASIAMSRVAGTFSYTGMAFASEGASTLALTAHGITTTSDATAETTVRF